ncbi:hypothetical protein AB6735_27225 [Mucilaginibacter sp. RCC_168]|uniref:hypothetical protein n=1 Tax=Mucilaginibacter sp. RCC_168 TaxID=3239221 RepID=UPI003526C2BF
MEPYRVRIKGNSTIIEESGQGFRVRVYKNRTGSAEISFVEATLYREEAMLVQYGRFTFEAIGTDDRPLNNGIDIDEFRATVDFFFRSLLDTDFYIISIPELSCLYGISRILPV